MMWLYAFLITCVIEIPIVVALADKTIRRKAASDAFAANLLTHPLAWYLIRNVGMSWLLIEILVMLTEAVIYRQVTRFSWLQAATAAGLANGITASASFLL